MAPFEVALVPLNMDKSEAVATATEALYEQLIAMGVEVFMDDRKERPGVKFAQMELIGIPVRITVGDRSLAEGNIELQERTSDQKQLIPVSEASKAIVAMIRRA
jgi:prolyl-tRNA synthetase